VRARQINFQDRAGPFQVADIYILSNFKLFLGGHESCRALIVRSGVHCWRRLNSGRVDSRGLELGAELGERVSKVLNFLSMTGLLGLSSLFPLGHFLLVGTL
jgi:hypothetical protein